MNFGIVEGLNNEEISEIYNSIIEGNIFDNSGNEFIAKYVHFCCYGGSAAGCGGDSGGCGWYGYADDCYYYCSTWCPANKGYSCKQVLECR